MKILRLKEVLKDKGVSAKSLALDVGVTPNAISNIAQGKSFPRPEVLLKMAKTLNVDVRELFEPTKDRDTLLQGFVKYDGDFIPIESVKDLRNLLKRIDKKEKP